MPVKPAVGRILETAMSYVTTTVIDVVRDRVAPSRELLERLDRIEGDIAELRRDIDARRSNAHRRTTQ